MAFASTTLAAKAGAPSTNKHANRDSARIDMRALFDEMDTNRDGLVRVFPSSAFRGSGAGRRLARELEKPLPHPPPRCEGMPF